MVGLLEAFDGGADLDTALKNVLRTTPEDVDRDFEAYAKKLVESIAIEPRWSPSTLAGLRLSTDAKPGDDAAKKKLADDLASLAWGEWQAGRRVDAEQALRRCDSTGVELPRASFLRGEMALARGAREDAVRSWKRGLELGGDDFRVRMALGKLALQDGKLDEAEAHFKVAETLFPGYPETELAAELGLAQIAEKREKPDDLQRARERWLAWNEDYGFSSSLGDWHSAAGRFAEAAQAYERANETDPFRRKLHVAWAKALEGAARWSEAAREWDLATLVPKQLDADQPEPLSDTERADLLGHRALALAKAGHMDEAVKVANEALLLDRDNESAKQALATKP
jgi:tetratricopeptide (TPR) repeat protein